MKWLPSWKNALLVLLAAGLLILAFPDFELWWTAWFALVPLMWAVERETERGHSCPEESTRRSDVPADGASPNASRSWGQECPRSFLLGWLFGTAFFFGTCWWLTYAPIHYAAVPWPIAYLLILIACLGAGVFPGIFAAILSFLLRRFGSRAFLAAPFVWVFSEFLRYWVTGNNWNAVGYSQFTGNLAHWASIGGVLLVSFAVVFYNFVSGGLILLVADAVKARRPKPSSLAEPHIERSEEEPTMFNPLDDGSDDDLNPFVIGGLIAISVLYMWLTPPTYHHKDGPESYIVAVQPNVPMKGLTTPDLERLRQRQIELAGAQISGRQPTGEELTAVQNPVVVILPESPMNFMYYDDREFQHFIGDFARRNNVSVLFNSAEPDASNGRYFNSAVMVGPDGQKLDQYDKLYLLPFGEAVPWVLESIVPAFVGNFSYGREYDLFPLGDAKAGVMICFESHFGQLSREYVSNGADVIIEMTNDGYLGPTPVLRQHLANAVFRAVETNRPVLRVTNVGITAYITENGTVLDPLPVYQEGTRVWTVSKSDGSQTFYVRYGDWFAWLCTMVTIGLVLFGLGRRLKHEQ